MSLAPQQFCVRWNSYHTNLQTVFPKLLTTENFVDVTLACENRQIKCHKVVLSACSTYFERLLIQNPCKHPIIFMKDMRFSEMQSLVDFMYKGEVNVSQDDLPSLLKSAEALQIRGLCGSDSGGLGSGSSQPGSEPETPIHSSAQQHHTKNNEPSKPTLTNDKPISPAFKDVSNSAIKSSLLHPSSNHHSDQTAGRSSLERQAAQLHPRRTAISEQTSTATSNESQPSNTATLNNSNARNHQRSSSTTTRQMSLLNDMNGEANLLGGGNTGEGSGVFKEETVEEDGLFYGEMENDDMECGDQTEEDLLQTGSTGLPNSVEVAALRRIRRREAYNPGLPPLTNPTRSLFDTATGDAMKNPFFGLSTSLLSSPDMSDTNFLACSIAMDLKRVKSYKRYTLDNLKEGLIAVKNGTSVYGAAKKYGIPTKTLRSWMQKYNIKSQFSREKKDERMSEIMNDADLIMKLTG